MLAARQDTLCAELGGMDARHLKRTSARLVNLRFMDPPQRRDRRRTEAALYRVWPDRVRKIETAAVEQVAETATSGERIGG